MIAGPNTLIILRKWVGQIYQTHGVAKEGGRYTAVCVCLWCTHIQKVLDRISLHCGIVRKVGKSAFRLEARQNYCQGVYIVAVRESALQVIENKLQSMESLTQKNSPLQLNIPVQYCCNFLKLDPDIAWLYLSLNMCDLKSE